MERVYQRKRVDDQAWRALARLRRRRWLGRVEAAAAKSGEMPYRKPRRRTG